MKIHLFMLPVLVGVMLSSVYLLPEAGEMAPSAIRMQMPFNIKDWIFRPNSPTEDEIKTLASDTQFSKATCLRPRPGEYQLQSGSAIPDRIDLSVVLSGHDLNNSIHRPERCMPSQGHVIGSSGDLRMNLPNGRQITVKRLLSVQSIPINQDRTQYASFQSVTYYFFVGHKAITQDHLQRTLMDMKDRLVYGMDQRWAYVSASMWYGKVPWIEKEVPIEEADRKLQQFLSDFGMQQIQWEQIEM